MTRQIVLDTETTGLEVAAGHRVIEIGAIELIGRRRTDRVFHCYLNPERAIDEGALRVHGITNEFLADKPRFADVADAFLEFIRGAELLIHNAAFDVAMLDAELARLDPPRGRIADVATITDTLALARQRFPGQRNRLDDLLKRLDIDASQRQLHGALLDASLLAEVWLAMTAGQTALALGGDAEAAIGARAHPRPVAGVVRLRVQRASDDERRAHDERMAAIARRCGRETLWARMPGAVAGDPRASVGAAPPFSASGSGSR
jgi:DNA polymerase-3 subunit epsilon